MKARRVTKQYFQLENGEKVYFFQPFKKPPALQEIQALMDRSAQVVMALARESINLGKGKSRRAPLLRRGDNTLIKGETWE